MSERNDSKHGHDGHDSYKLELVGLAADAERPKVVVQALDKGGGVVHTQVVSADGKFALPAAALKAAERVVLGAPDGKGGVRPDASVTYRASELAVQIKDGTLALAEGIWSVFRFHWVCVSGSVQVCWRRPWWFGSIISAATRIDERLAVGARAALAAPATSAALRVRERIVPSFNDLLVWPTRCAPVCLGTVEVYRRTCCCWPIIFDTRIPDLIRDLEIYVERLPKLPPVRVPPIPPPPPGDPLTTPFFKGGALNELALNATNDLHALRSLPAEQAALYIQDRPYLLHRLCLCGAALKVGSGTIQPDGKFNICWLEALRLQQPNCYDQYAYVVKQTIGGTTTTIYDGLAAGAWFAPGTHPVLTSYNANAFSCNETGHGDGDAYVFLNLIGDTESHELTTPTSTGWDRVGAPGATSGLLFPGLGPNSSHLRNLGGAFELTFIFSLGMRAPAIDAKYYRISICGANALGEPTGTRVYYDTPLTWQRIAGADIVGDLLGPDTVGGEQHLYRIPYSDEPWVGSVRYHALINTLLGALDGPSDLASPAVNHLITLEVFNAAGERLRPLGTPASAQPGTELTKPFKYRRWFQPGGSVGDDTVEVPFAGLTHLYCWDNRRPVADITRLVMNGVASDEECQFLHGAGSSTFAIEYRAYVPDERFQFAHGIGWLRGLNGSVANGGVGALGTPASPSNVGKPPAAAANSSSDTFEHMLTRLDAPNPPTVLHRCSFAATLTTYAKTTDGEDLNYPYAQETAAFALAIE
jgi:hypothetical protein